MYHYGKAETNLKADQDFADLEAAIDAATEASIYSDDILAVWDDVDTSTPEALAWGGTIYCM